MITVEEADRIISQNIKLFPSVRVPLQEAYGRVVHEDLFADRDIPPYDRVTMDGIGICFDAWEQGCTTFSVEGLQKAGIPGMTLKDKNASFEVMTGAVVPRGCDCVVPYEDVDVDNGTARVRDGVTVTRAQYIHACGSDYPDGALLLKKGCRLLAPQIAIAAAVGKADILVSDSPKIAVVGTGDEVVPVNGPVESHQVRRSNACAIEAALKLSHYEKVTCFHINDDPQALTAELGRILEEFDALILSGGVSMGKLDYVPEVLERLEVKSLFHQVKQRPGKPMWFGVTQDGNPVFGLPGNPVSTQVGVTRHVLPFLNRASGASVPAPEFAILESDVDVGTNRTYFLPVRIRCGEGCQRLSTPVFPKVSGDYAALAVTDGFCELPADTFRFSKGFSARFYPWQS